MKKLFLFVAFISVGHLGFSQNPGNVGTTNLTAWFKPDGLTIGNVSTWSTTFPIGVSSVTVTDGATPYPQATRTPTGDVSNYNTTIHFTNTNSSPTQRLVNTGTLDLLDNISSTHQGTFVVAYYLPASTANDHFVTYNESIDAIQFRNLGATGRIALGKSSNSVNACRNWVESYKPQVISYKGNRSGTGTMKFYNKSYLTTTQSASGSSGASGLYFGVKPNGGTGFQGNSGLNGFLHEVIFYDTDLSNVDLLKVHSYLAIKFGTTLLNTGGGGQGDYLSTSGLTIWDASVAATYHNDVIGLGRDDTQGLLQKQSHSFDDVTRVYLDSLKTYNAANTGTFVGNVSYVVLGSNNGTMCSSVAANNEVPANSSISTRLTREWKVTKTNMSDSISFDFKTANCSAFANASCLRLLVDDDGVFTNASVYSSGNGLQIVNNAGVITVSGVSNLQIPDNGTHYITIGVIDLNPELGMDTVICPGGMIGLDVTTANATYIWQDNSINPVYTINDTGKFWVELNVNGCIASDTLLVGDGPGPLVNLGGDTSICQNDSIVLDATNTGAFYLWQDGSTLPTFNASLAGSYWVEVDNLCGVVRDTIAISITDYPIVNLGADSILCLGDSLPLDASFLNATYRWQNGVTDSILTVSSTGVYWVDVTVSQCTTRDSLTATFNSVPVVNLGMDTAICIGDSIVLDANNPTSSYLWNTGDTNQTLTVSTGGQYWVGVTKLNCFSSDSILISITPLPTINLGPDQVVCEGESYYVDAYNVNGTYVWNDGSTNYNLQVTQSDTYWVDVNVSMCHSYDTVVFTFNPIPIIDLGNDTVICFPDSISLDASYPNATYLWDDNSTFALREISSQGSYSVLVNHLNCSFNDTIFINVEPKPNANLGNDTIICPGTSFSKGELVSGAGYLWQDGNSSFFYDIQSPGQYWLQVTKGNCSNSDTLQVDSAFYPEVYLGEDTLLCVSDSITLSSGFYNSSYAWSTGETDSMITVGLPGDYWLDVTNICGTVRDEVELSYTTLPEIDLGEDSVLCLGEALTLDAYWFNASRYLWLDGSDLSYFTVYEDGDYLVNVTNLCGSVEDTINVEFRHCDCDLFIANAFTPNDDGLDDSFGPETYCELKAYHFIIFDRWGQEVFNSLDPSEKWNGKLYGEYLHVGTYSYVLKYNFKKLGPKTNYQVKYGTVTLIR